VGFPTIFTTFTAPCTLGSVERSSSSASLSNSNSPPGMSLISFSHHAGFLRRKKIQLYSGVLPM